MTKKKKIIIFLIIILLGSTFITAAYFYINNTYLNEQLELTKSDIESRLAKLETNDFSDGTYNLETLEIVSYDTGYQVSFYQIGDDYTEEEFLSLIKRFLSVSSDGVISAGKYEGVTEISFNIASLETAIDLAIEFNQASIWDWASSDIIDTGGSGIR